MGGDWGGLNDGVGMNFWSVIDGNIVGMLLNKWDAWHRIDGLGALDSGFHIIDGGSMAAGGVVGNDAVDILGLVRIKNISSRISFSDKFIFN